MDDPQREQGGEGVVEDGPAAAVEFGDGGDEEGEGDGFDEIPVATGGQGQGVYSIFWRGGGFLGRAFDGVADVGFVLDALPHNTVGEDEEVGGEGESPGPRDG